MALPMTCTTMCGRWCHTSWRPRDEPTTATLSGTCGEPGAEMTGTPGSGVPKETDWLKDQHRALGRPHTAARLAVAVGPACERRSGLATGPVLVPTESL
jgi:hypothetical protein